MANDPSTQRFVDIVLAALGTTSPDAIETATRILRALLGSPDADLAGTPLAPLAELLRDPQRESGAVAAAIAPLLSDSSALEWIAVLEAPAPDPASFGGGVATGDEQLFSGLFGGGGTDPVMEQMMREAGLSGFGSFDAAGDERQLAENLMPAAQPPAPREFHVVEEALNSNLLDDRIDAEPPGSLDLDPITILNTTPLPIPLATPIGPLAEEPRAIPAPPPQAPAEREEAALSPETIFSIAPTEIDAPVPDTQVAPAPAAVAPAPPRVAAEPRRAPRMTQAKLADQGRQALAELRAAVDAHLAEQGGDEALERVQAALRLLERTLWRLGYKTFRSVASAMELVIEAQRRSPQQAPPELDAELQALASLADQMLDGKVSKRRAFYDVIGRMEEVREAIELAATLERDRRDATDRERVFRLLEERAREEGVAMPAAGRRRAELTRLQGIFMKEMGDHLNSMTRQALLLGRGGANPEAVNSLLRSAHSIKGSAAAVKYRSISSLAHRMEDLLTLLRDHSITPTRSLLALTLSGVDALQALRDEAEHVQDGPPADFTPLEESFRDLAARIGENLDLYRASSAAMETMASDFAPAQAAAAATPESVAAARYISVEHSQLDGLMNLAADLVISRTRLSGGLGELRAQLNELTLTRRRLHSLHGSLRAAVRDSLRGTVSHRGTRVGAGSGAKGLLQDFSDEEFDRFSKFDVWMRDLREAIARFDLVADRISRIDGEVDQSSTLIGRIANDLHESVLRTRMVPMRESFDRFQRVVFDLSARLGKPLRLETYGGDVAIDKAIIERIIDPLTHLIRNAADHGIEDAATRESQAKQAHGTIRLGARQLGSQIIVEVSDDGAGIDEARIRDRAIERGILGAAEAARATTDQLHALLLRSGFSTAAEVTDVSGRGVGLDVVNSAIAELKGTMAISSVPGEGSTIRLRLPSTLAISEALLFSAGQERFAIPLDAIQEICQYNAAFVHRVGEHMALRLRDTLVPLVDLSALLQLDDDFDRLNVLILADGESRTGVVVGELIGREEIVVKALGAHVREASYLFAGTILADGNVTLILDPSDLVRATGEGASEALAEAASAVLSATTRKASAPTIRVVEARAAEASAPDAPAEPKPAPVAVPAAPAPAAEPVRARAGQGGRKHRRGGPAQKQILVVDDSVSIRAFVTGVLQAAGYATTEAFDGVDALEKLEQETFDLVLTDLEMPRMHGYELITEIRHTPALRELPIVVLTGRMGEKHSRKAMEVGASAFLVKPFEEAELLALLQRFLSAGAGA